VTDDAFSIGTVSGSADLTGAGLNQGEPSNAPAPAADGPAPDPVYPAVEDWVIDYFLPMFRRTLGGDFRWCAQWWRHGEAISRLSSLWHSWEVLRLRPGTGIAAWYRDYLDHQLPILMGARGPFYQCSETAHREPRETVAVRAPADWWDTNEVLYAAFPDDMPAIAAGNDSLPGPPNGPLPDQDDRAGAGEDHA
jgi:Domain of unknown function (DUF4913)